MKHCGNIRWCWYISQANEMFLDLDSGRAVSRALSVLRRALRNNVSWNKLPVKSVWLYPSVEPRHAHLVIVLKQPLPFYERVAWSLWMGTDRLRSAYVMERYRWGNKLLPFSGEAELLSVLKPYGFRKPDAVCDCKEKHKKKSVTDKCSAMKLLLGEQRSADYFPRAKDRKKRKPVRFAWGRIPLTNIKEWRV